MEKIILNPAPKNNRCNCCGKIGSLRKNYRQTDQFGGVSASWECKDCIPLNYDCYRKMKNESPGTIINEWCPCCESEVILDNIFKIQSCPNCDKPIKPCSLCNMDEVDCNNCKIE